MTLIRSLLNLIMIAVYTVRMVLYVIARIFGSIPGALALCMISGMIYGERRESASLIYGVMGFILACRVSGPYLKPRGSPRFLRAPAAPPPPPPIASGITGRADDPNEATVIGRLDPKLRDLLRQKPTAS